MDKVAVIHIKYFTFESRLTVILNSFKKSDILYGYYNLKTIDSEYLERIKMLLVKAREGRSNLAGNYVPEIVHSITWKDLKPSLYSDEVTWVNIKINKNSFVLFYFKFNYHKENHISIIAYNFAYPTKVVCYFYLRKF